MHPASARAALSAQVTVALAGIGYKPGWMFRYDPELRILIVTYPAADAYDPRRTFGGRATALLPYSIPATEIAGWVWRVIMQIEEHEAGEFFTVDGERPHDPHQQPAPRAHLTLRNRRAADTTRGDSCAGPPSSSSTRQPDSAPAT